MMMKIGKLLGYISIMIVAVLLAGCGSIPEEQQKNYALIESKVSEHGWDVDRLPSSSLEITAYVGYVDGKAIFPAKPSIDLAPGDYQIQLGMRCSNSATCGPGAPYNLALEPGKRYVLKPNGQVFVSDRFSSRKNEVLYSPQK